MGDIYIAEDKWHRCDVQLYAKTRVMNRPAGSIWQCDECERYWWRTVFDWGNGHPWKRVMWWNRHELKIIRELKKSVGIET